MGNRGNRRRNMAFDFWNTGDFYNEWTCSKRTVSDEREKAKCLLYTTIASENPLAIEKKKSFIFHLSFIFIKFLSKVCTKF